MAAEITQIVDPSTGSSAEVLIGQGFNCFSWRPVLSEGPRELLWAVDDIRTGQTRPSSSGIPLLFPFPGRIGGARFEFEGKAYELPPGDALGNAIHGFALNRPWRAASATEDSVAAEFRLSTDAPDAAGCWPSDFELHAKYQVVGPRLTLDFEYANVGDANLPCGFGTHAYFRLPLSDGGSFERTVIRAPVDAEWLMNDMLPTGSTTPLSKDTPLPSGLALGDRHFDTPYRVPADGAGVTTEVKDPATGMSVRQTCDPAFGCCVIYTPQHREAVCLEPYTCVPDPFRLNAEGVESGLQVLAPGENRRVRIVLEVAEP